MLFSSKDYIFAKKEVYFISGNFFSKKVRIRKKKQPEHGAAFVEAAIVLFLFFLVIGVFIYVAVRFYKFQVLQEVVTTSLAHYSVDADCETQTLKDNLVTKIAEKLETQYGIAVNSDQIDISTPTACYSEKLSTSMVKHPDSCNPLFTETVQLPRCLIGIVVRWNAPCYLCGAFNFPQYVQVSSHVPIEDPCFLDEGSASSPVTNLCNQMRIDSATDPTLKCGELDTKLDETSAG